MGHCNISFIWKGRNFQCPSFALKLLGNPLTGDIFKCWDPFGIEFNSDSVAFPMDDLDNISAWTVYNNPVSP
jgi:hypothetical protein